MKTLHHICSTMVCVESAIIAIILFTTVIDITIPPYLG